MALLCVPIFVVSSITAGGFYILQQTQGEPDPCLTASLVANSTSISDMTFTLGDEQIEQEFNHMKLNFNATDGVCGPLNYQILEPMWNYQSLFGEIYQSEETRPSFKFKATDEQDIGEHEFSVAVGLENYPLTEKARMEFKITVKKVEKIVVPEPVVEPLTIAEDKEEDLNESQDDLSNFQLGCMTLCVSMITFVLCMINSGKPNINNNYFAGLYHKVLDVYGETYATKHKNQLLDFETNCNNTKIDKPQGFQLKETTYQTWIELKKGTWFQGDLLNNGANGFGIKMNAKLIEIGWFNNNQGNKQNFRLNPLENK